MILSLILGAFKLTCRSLQARQRWPIVGPNLPSDIAPLTEGIELDDGPARASSARIVTSAKDRCVVELVLTEGRKREIRRMFEAIGIQGRVSS